MLVVVRNHREKLGDVGVEEGAEVGKWLGVISRAVVGSVREDELGRDGEEGRKGEGDVGDWNVVQNNGMFALDLCLYGMKQMAWGRFMQLEPASVIHGVKQNSDDVLQLEPSTVLRPKSHICYAARTGPVLTCFYSS